MLSKVKVLKQTMRCYSMASGQAINFRKSLIYFGKGVNIRIQKWIFWPLIVRSGSMPFKYLGVFKMVPLRFFNGCCPISK